MYLEMSRNLGGLILLANNIANPSDPYILVEKLEYSYEMSELLKYYLKFINVYNTDKNNKKILKIMFNKLQHLGYNLGLSTYNSIKNKNLSTSVIRICYSTLFNDPRNSFMDGSDEESIITLSQKEKAVYEVFEKIFKLLQLTQNSFSNSKLYEGTWSLPKGRIKESESFLDGAIRETKEETSLTQSIDYVLQRELLKSNKKTETNFISNIKFNYTYKTFGYNCVYYIGHLLKPFVLHIKPSDEISEIKLVPLSLIIKMFPIEYGQILYDGITRYLSTHRILFNTITLDTDLLNTNDYKNSPCKNKEIDIQISIKMDKANELKRILGLENK